MFFKEGASLDQIRGIVGRQELSCGRLLGYRAIFLRLLEMLQRCGVGDFNAMKVRWTTFEKPRQRHRQRTGLLDPSHFQAGWEGRFFFGVVSDQGPVSNEGLEFTEDLL